ncbi:MAG: redoxin domain-containing protein [Bacteroidales bacterium]|nr:redoxin domain-containing protein [Bacteroidales bacterium]
MKAIDTGDIIPGLLLTDINGQVHDISKIRGKKQIVLIFYPPDGSNGCKNSVCQFHDMSDYFDREKFEIFGICGLPQEKIKDSMRFQDLNFPIICDNDFTARKSFGIPFLSIGKYNRLFIYAFGLQQGRLTFVTNRDGRIIYKTNSSDGLKCQADEALKILFLLGKNIQVNSAG